MATTKVTQPVIDLNAVAAATDVSALKMPAGGAFSGSPAEGMMRCDNSQTSEGSNSCMQHYTGNNEWKSFVNTAQTFTVEYLIIAGGGGAGSADWNANALNGGGGAGGYLNSYASEQSGGPSSTLTPFTATAGTNYRVTVGEGGAGSANDSSTGGSGADSKFGTIGSEIIATGGGGGGSRFSTAGLTGGSGGGAASTGTAGSGTANQGNAGGSGASGINAGGSGGGAGAAGTAGTSGSSAAGGAGLASSITGVSTTRATGGASHTYAVGAANSGDGGGAYANNGGNPGGGAGGSGIVILRTTAAQATFSSGVTCNGTSGGGTISGDTTNMPSGEYFYSITETTSTSETVQF